MANVSIKALTIIALTGTSLSGCAVVGGAADGAWSGTKSVAKFVSFPVRALLRDAPKDDVQFAEAGVDVDTVDETVTTVKTDVKIDRMVETVIDVKQPQMLGVTPVSMPLTTASVQSVSIDTESLDIETESMDMGEPASWLDASAAQSSVTIVETIAIEDFQSIDVVTVGLVSYVRRDGAGSLEDWQTCDVEAGGFWTFDAANVVGTLNPKFESCMQTKNYIQDIQFDEAMVADLDSVAPATLIKPLP